MEVVGWKGFTIVTMVLYGNSLGYKCIDRYRERSICGGGQLERCYCTLNLIAITRFNVVGSRSLCNMLCGKCIFI